MLHVEYQREVNRGMKLITVTPKQKKNNLSMINYITESYCVQGLLAHAAEQQGQ